MGPEAADMRRFVVDGGVKGGVGVGEKFGGGDEAGGAGAEDGHGFWGGHGDCLVAWVLFSERQWLRE